MHPGGPRLDAATAIIAATFGHWRRKVAAATAIIAAMLGHWRQAACCLPCLLPKAPGHLVTAAVATRYGPGPRPWGVICRSQWRHTLRCYLVLNDTKLELISGNLYQNFVL